MPTYEYRCPEGHEFERFYRKMGDAAAELPCPVCGKEATRQLTGGAGLVFKGSGFYLTDYGKNAHRKGGSGSSGASSSSESSGGDKSAGESTSSSTGSSGSSESKSSGESKPNEKSSDTKASSALPSTKSTKSEG